MRLLQALLMSVPLSHSLGFFRREGWEDQVGVCSLPSQRLGFVQCELQHSFLFFERVAPLSEDGILGPSDLRENRSARAQGQMAAGASGASIRRVFIRLF